MIEVDSAGREIRRWYVPVDKWSVGVRGEALLVAINAGGRQDLALEVRSNGTYQIVAFEGTRPPQVVECPPYRGFGESAYVRCARFDRRLVIYEGPCT